MTKKTAPLQVPFFFEIFVKIKPIPEQSLRQQLLQIRRYLLLLRN